MQQDKIVIADYDPNWSAQFAALQSVFRNHLKDAIITIEHVGSTSVEGLAAKPILDIDIVVKDDDRVVDSVIEQITTLGYRHRGDLGIIGREVLKAKSIESPLDGFGTHWLKHHLYVCREGCVSLQNHLDFRDYLRGHPQDRLAYGKLKKSLALQYPYDIDAYIDGKTAFILQVLEHTGFAQDDLDDIKKQNEL